jgi:hypothetical protein
MRTRARRPKLVRGDCGFGSDPLMAPLEERQQPYLFKLKLSKNVKRHIERIFWDADWTDAGEAREGKDGSLRLGGWQAPRRVVVLRRPLQGEVLIAQDDNGQQLLGFIEADRKAGKNITGYEYAVAGDQYRLRDSKPRPTLPGSGRCRECLRRAEEPVGLGRLHHPRPAPLPALGARRGAHLQLVEPVRPPGPPQGPARGPARNRVSRSP